MAKKKKKKGINKGKFNDSDRSEHAEKAPRLLINISAHLLRF